LATFFTLVMSNVGATVLLVPLAVNIAIGAGAVRRRAAAAVPGAAICACRALRPFGAFGALWPLGAGRAGRALRAGLNINFYNLRSRDGNIHIYSLSDLGNVHLNLR
jgi:di/tricarboxylate transporter